MFEFLQFLRICKDPSLVFITQLLVVVEFPFSRETRQNTAVGNHGSLYQNYRFISLRYYVPLSFSIFSLRFFPTTAAESIVHVIVASRCACDYRSFRNNSMLNVYAAMNFIRACARSFAQQRA